MTTDPDVPQGPEKTDLRETEDDHWPWLLRLAPQTVLVIFIAVAVTAFAAVMVADRFEWSQRGPDSQPLWFTLYNNRPVEWTQWFLLPAAAVAAAYLAGRLQNLSMRGAASFFLWFAAGLALMFVEDAGDLRHVIADSIASSVGNEVGPFPVRFVAELPYMALLAGIPLYALLRYGRYVWDVRATRWLLLVGYGLYGLAAGASTIRYVGQADCATSRGWTCETPGFYVRIGSWIDQHLFAGEMPVPEGQPPEFGHLLFVDGVFEETAEMLAAACLLAAILAFAASLRRSDTKTPAPD